jgi:hypothetical protein
VTVALSTALPLYRVAAAELPETVRLARDPSGAVVAIDGVRWTDAAEQAIAAGAAAVVVRHPASAGAEDLARLEGSGIPIVLDRPLVRADAVIAARAIVADAGPFATAVVECHAPGPALLDALRDAAAWARVIVGGAVAVSSSAFESAPSGGGGLALLEAPAGVPVSLIAAASPGAPPRGRVRATGLGETRVEVDGDEHELRMEAGDASGRRVAPRLFEAPARVALRRAAAALAGGEAPGDLAEFALDEALASALLPARTPVRAA